MLAQQGYRTFFQCGQSTLICYGYAFGFTESLTSHLLTIKLNEGVAYFSIRRLRGMKYLLSELFSSLIIFLGSGGFSIHV